MLHCPNAFHPCHKTCFFSWHGPPPVTNNVITPWSGSIPQCWQQIPQSFTFLLFVLYTCLELFPFMLTWKTTVPLFNEFWGIQEYSQFLLTLNEKWKKHYYSTVSKKKGSFAYINYVYKFPDIFSESKSTNTNLEGHTDKLDVKIMCRSSLDKDNKFKEKQFIFCRIKESAIPGW